MAVNVLSRTNLSSHFVRILHCLTLAYSGVNMSQPYSCIKTFLVVTDDPVFIIVYYLPVDTVSHLEYFSVQQRDLESLKSRILTRAFLSRVDFDKFQQPGGFMKVGLKIKQLLHLVS